MLRIPPPPPEKRYLPTRKGRSSTSKMVVQRIRDTQALKSAIGVFKEKAAAGLGERLAPELRDGETLPDFALTLELVGRSVETAVEELDAADERYRRESLDNTWLADQCDQVARLEVYPAAVNVRRSIDAVYGKREGFRLHGIEGRVLRKPGRQRYQVERMVRWLRDPGKDLPEPILAGFTPDREGWLEELGPAFAKLEKTLRQLEAGRVKEQDLQGETQQAMADFDRSYGEAVRLAERAFVMAGLHERIVKSLRSGVARRSMIRWARSKRRARGEKKARIERSAGEARSRRTGTLAAIRGTVSRWFRKAS